LAFRCSGGGIMSAPWRDDGESGSPVLRLEGELDLSVAEELEQQLLHALRRADERLCVDLSEVTYIDSSSVRALLRAAAFAHDRGKRVQVTSASGISRRVIELAGVEDVLGLDSPL
jgi:anti-sigma B factor antagonist